MEISFIRTEEEAFLKYELLSTLLLKPFCKGCKLNALNLGFVCSKEGGSGYLAPGV